MDKEGYGEDNVGHNEPGCVCVYLWAVRLWHCGGGVGLWME